MIRAISRAAIGGSLTLVRLPVDGVLRLAGDGGAGAVALDRAEATLRSVAGFALADDALVHDAARRRQAADERARALRLHSQAVAEAEGAAQTVQESREEAARVRARASESAEREKREAAERKAARKGKATASARKRREATASAAARRKDAIAGEEKRARLQVLETRADAISEKEEALAAREDAKQLRKAASKAKAQRKAKPR